MTQYLCHRRSDFVLEDMFTNMRHKRYLFINVNIKEEVNFKNFQMRVLLHAIQLLPILCICSRNTRNVVFLERQRHRCWIQPSKDTSNNRRGIWPSLDMSTYQHRDFRYGHSPNYDNVHGVQHCFITPGQHRHVNSFNLVDTIYDLFRHIFMSPDWLVSHMKIYLGNWYLSSSQNGRLLKNHKLRDKISKYTKDALGQSTEL